MPRTRTPDHASQPLQQEYGRQMSALTLPLEAKWPQHVAGITALELVLLNLDAHFVAGGSDLNTAGWQFIATLRADRLHPAADTCLQAEALTAYHQAEACHDCRTHRWRETMSRANEHRRWAAIAHEFAREVAQSVEAETVSHDTDL